MSIDAGFVSLNTIAPMVSWATLPLARHTLSGSTMGTRYAAVFCAPLGADIESIEKALEAAVTAVDDQMSNWKPTSDISRLNAAEIGTWVKVSPNVLEVIETGLEVGRRSGGRFDIGMGAIVDAWGFGPSRQAGAEPLSGSAIMPAANLIESDGRNAMVCKTGPVQLDLCGIAKGFGVDELARALNNLGIEHYLVSIDGEVRAQGMRLDGTPWRVAIERPDRSERTASAVIALENQAIATSGDYRHWREHKGRLISHTMDPRRGAPAENALASVSVIAPSCMIADAWATALLVAGETDGPDLAQANGLDALFVLRRGNELLELPIGRFR